MDGTLKIKELSLLDIVYHPKRTSLIFAFLRVWKGWGGKEPTFIKNIFSHLLPVSRTCSFSIDGHVGRMFCFSGTDLSDDAVEEKKSTSCHALPCVGMERNENDAKSGQDEAGSSTSAAESAGNTRSKRKRKHRGRWADKNQNMSPRLAPVGQEDEEDSSAAQKRTGSSAGACGEVMTGGGVSARSSIVVDSASQGKRHSGAKLVSSDVTSNEGGGHDDVSRGGGEGGGVQTRGRAGGVPGSRTGNPGVSKADVNRATHDTQFAMTEAKTLKSAAATAHSDVTRTQPPDRTQTRAAVTSSHRRSQYDAVAVPNTESFSSC